MIKWIKPSGVEIETNDLEETVAYVESLGWKRAEKKRTRRTKEQIAADKALNDG